MKYNSFSLGTYVSFIRRVFLSINPGPVFSQGNRGTMYTFWCYAPCLGDSPLGTDNSLPPKEIYSLFDADSLKMPCYTGDKISISVVASFRTEKLGSQQSKPEPLFRYTWIALHFPLPSCITYLYSFLAWNSFHFLNHFGHSPWKKL